MKHKKHWERSFKAIVFYTIKRVEPCSIFFLVIFFLILISDLIPPSEVDGSNTYESVVGKETVPIAVSLSPYLLYLPRFRVHLIDLIPE